MRAARWALILLLGGCAEPPRGWMVGLYGAVVDAEGALLPGAEVSLADAETGALMGTVRAADDGSWYLPVLVQVGQEGQRFPVAIAASAPGYQRGLSYAELILRDPPPDYAWYTGPGQSFQTLPLRLPAGTLVPGGEGALGEGLLLDASTGEPVPRARLILREGYNAPDSRAVVAQVSTDAEGRYAVSELPGGVYTAGIEPFPGYGPSRFPVLVAPDGARDQRGLVAPPTGPGGFRVALSWDPGVAALNLHLTGPVAGSSADSAGFHLYAEDPVHPPSGDLIAELELAIEGLQTAVVYTIRERGAYRASGFDVTNAAVTDSVALSRSGAMVQLWWDDEAWMEGVSPETQATLWRALELDPVTGEVTRLQEYASDIEEDRAIDF